MKTKSIFILLISCIISSCTVQCREEEPLTLPSNISYRNVGSAKKMEGNILLVTIFVRKNGETQFSEKTKNEYFDSLGKACAWLEGKANQNGKNVSFVQVHFPETQYIPKNIDYTTVHPNEIIRKALNIDDVKGYFKNQQLKNKCNGYIVLIYTEQHDQCCYTLTADYNSSPDLTESCVFNRNTNNNFPTVIAHELLHAFGAVDIYRVNFDKTKYNYDKTFEASVMRVADRSLKELYIDDFNLYMVGLSDNKQYWFDDIAYNIN